MTKLETLCYPDPIPGFDVLKWKRENQARILRETEGMTREEIRKHIRKGAERFDEGQKRRQAEIRGDQ